MSETPGELADKKVLVFAEFGTLNGGENSFLSLLPFLRSDFQMVVALPCPSPFADELHRLDIPTVGLTFQDENQSRLSLEAIRDHLSSLIRKVSPDLVHANSLSMTRMLGPVLEPQKVRGVGYLRDIIKLNKTVVSDINCFDQVVAVSDATAQFHVAQGLDPSRVITIRNGVDLKRFAPRAKSFQLHRALGIHRDALVVLSIGQIGMRKGWDDLLLAAEKVDPSNEAVHFVIVGERNSNKDEALRFENELKDRANRPGLSGCVHFPGWVRDIPKWMNDADMLVHPAKQEPLGRVLLEAAASGLPVIATDVGGTREIFTRLADGASTAQLVPPNDPERLALAMGELIHSTKARNQLAVATRKMACERLNVVRAATELGQVYAEWTG